MGYLSQDLIASDPTMQARVAQAAAEEGETFPDQWMIDRRRTWAAAPGWDDAWDSALAGGITDPGRDEAVITDGMILGQVQAMRA